MEQAWIGKVMFVGLIFLAIWGVTALLSAKGEGARRFRLVTGGALALLGVYVMVMAMGPFGAIVVLLVGGAVAWIVKGFRK